MQRLIEGPRADGQPSLADRTAAVLDRYLDDDHARQPLGLAVSGGGDSAALLCVVAAWARARTWPLIAFTVDHGLRPEAADEAEWVAERCQALGVQHRILRWRGGRANPAAARAGRHALLADALRRAGGRYLLTGHTLDDQLETFLMRARQGSTWYGLGGMDTLSVSPAWPEGRGTFVLRSLLEIRRAALRDWLQAHGHHWVDDPTNDDRAFERVRMRQWIAGLSFDAQQRLVRISRRLSFVRRVERRAMAAHLDAAVACTGAGQLVWQRGAGASAGTHRPERDARILSLLLQLAAGRGRPPSQAGVRGLLATMASEQSCPGRTLGGAWVAWRGGSVLLSRDPGAAEPVPSAQDQLWDNRFERCGTGLAFDGAEQVADRGQPGAMEQGKGLSLPAIQPPDAGQWHDLTDGRLAALKASMKH